MQHLDPRVWGIRHPLAAVLLFLLLSVVFVWGNLRVEKRGILDSDVILREDDPFRVMDRYVQEKLREGFEGREFIPFILNAGVRSAEDAEKIVRITRAAQATFGETILSLATAPAYHDTGETLLDEPYVTSAMTTAPGFQVGEWQRRITNDDSVFGLLVGRNFSWASIVRYLPPGYDEVKEFRRTVEFLEGRAIPWWEWLWKKDISPKESWLRVSGWTMGRGLIDQGLNVDILTLVFLGVLLTFPVFWVTLGSGRAALLSVSVMVVGGFVWTRGAMGLFGIPERVFSLLAYASVIVQGTSFALHKFAAVKESAAADRTQGWLLARSVDGVITTTAMLSAFGFATLWSFGLKPIRELGVAAALGVVWLLVMASVFLPAFDLLTAPHLMKKRERSFLVPTFLCRGVALVSSLTRRVTMVPLFLEQVATKNMNVALWLTQRARPWWMLGGVCTLLMFVGVLFGKGEIRSRTKALEFIRGTVVEQEARSLNQPGNVGFEFLDLLVEPVRGEGMTNPRFLSRAWELQTAIKGIPGSRETSSILGTVHRISLESFKKPLPETLEEIAAAFFLIENRLAPAVQRQLYFPGGVRISVSYGTDDSVKLGQFRDAVLDLARRSFPDLKVNAFNKVPLYPQVDKYVREGKVYNVLTSQIGIACLCGLILWRGNRQLRRVRLAPLWGGVVMSLPLCFATAVLGVTMWLFHIPLDMATAPIGALAINAATDFSLYLALSYQKALETSSVTDALRKTLDAEGKVILADCLLNTCCFLPLLTSHFLPVRQLGWMMGLMLVACAVGALLLMTALLPWCVTRKEPRYVNEILPAALSFEPVLSMASSERRADRAGYHRASAPAA